MPCVNKEYFICRLRIKVQSKIRPISLSIQREIILLIKLLVIVSKEFSLVSTK